LLCVFVEGAARFCGVVVIVNEELEGTCDTSCDKGGISKVGATEIGASRPCREGMNAFGGLGLAGCCAGGFCASGSFPISPR